MMLPVMARMTLLKCTTDNICIAFVGRNLHQTLEHSKVFSTIEFCLT